MENYSAADTSRAFTPRSISISEYQMPIPDSSCGSISRQEWTTDGYTQISVNTSPRSSITLQDAERRVLPAQESEYERQSTEDPLPGGRLSNLTISSWLGSIGKKHRQRNSTLSGWWWETASISLSAVCVGLIVVILGIIDGKALADWKLLIKPNSVIAILSTVARSSLLVPIAECISQLKWTHFSSSARSLSHLQIFDDASRGPWGSLTFLWKVRPTAVIATAGALVTIITLAFEPTAQQIIEYPSRNAPLANATSSVAIATGVFPRWSYRDWSGIYISPNKELDDIVLNEKAAFHKLVTTMFSDSAVYEQPQINCPTLDCRWTNLTTLDMCSSCRNYTVSASDSLECNYTFKRPKPQSMFKYYYPDPNTPSFGNFTALQDYLSTHKVGNLDLFADCSYGQYPGVEIKNVDFIDSRDLYPIRATQVEYELVPKMLTMIEARILNSSSVMYGNITADITLCQIEFCLNRYESLTLQDGQLSEKLSSTEKLAYVGRKDSAYSKLKALSDAWKPSSTLYPIGDDWGSVAIYLEKLLDTSATHDDFTFFDSGKLAYQYISYRDLRTVSTNIAHALSSMLRSERNLNITFVEGDAYTQETYIHVRWAWLSFPICIVLLTTMLLITTIIQSIQNGNALFKSSLIALLFHGLEGWNKEELDATKDTEHQETPQSLIKRAKSMRARFERAEDGELKFLRAD
ncbi:uncharacterized protein K452DRAFT_166926 [Aplosporella prunicola CBS 121167]|uniref:Uncharacterized protein n=1 Tax=Aplosporella prunicola CBS 121167 TaxID=1176127 RepID=A0A6A6BI67_9PEZI|nr:uncharacterized protein K452DRAFT_166926 [Aplosporella prunicola CBS 121167]KAF2143123.1 hypothetical protein K452DRAFT_166926 [Aplosporella prunicola CBS 121167]